jgi:hypothetical protein
VELTETYFYLEQERHARYTLFSVSENVRAIPVGREQAVFEVRRDKLTHNLAKVVWCECMTFPHFYSPLLLKWITKKL